MPDNTQITTGSGDTVRDIDRGGVKTQVMQLDVGGQYAESLVNPFNPVPTSDASTQEAQGPDQPFFVSLVGDPNGDFAGVNILEKLVDDSGELKMAVKVVNPPKQDVQGAQMASDAPAPINLVGAVGQFLYIDTTGYQSIEITSPTTGGFNASFVTSSNDGAFWSSLLGYLVTNAPAAPTASIVSGASYVFPVTGKFIRLQISAAGAAVAYLRNIPAPNPAVIMPQNIASVAGSTAIGANVAGSLAVGGAVTSAALATGATNPLVMGGIDSGTPGLITSNVKGTPLVRSLLTDNTGRLRLAEEASTTNNQNVPSLAVQEVSSFEGQSLLELLAQMLLELRINNLLMAELPNKIYSAVQSLQLPSSQQNLFTGFASDDPAAYRSDPTIFN